MAEKRIIRPTAYILLDKRREKKDGTIPVRLVVKYEGEMRLWGLDLYLTEVDFRRTKKDTISSTLPKSKRDKLESSKSIIEEAIVKARNLILEMNDFTFDEFDNKMFPKGKKYLFEALESKYQELVNEGRAGYASSYLCTLNAFKMYRGGSKKREGYKVTTVGGKEIQLEKVDQTLLKDFEKWFIRAGGSYSSVGIYLRNIRVILNQALENGTITATPFGKKKYEIPDSEDRKLALTLEEIGKIQFAELPLESNEEKYRDYWMFLYYTGGMNVKDMAMLKYKDITNDEISYYRAKTYLKKKRKTKIVVPLDVQAARIIDKWGNKPVHPEKYVFPILKYGINPMTERRMVIDETAKINRAMKNIAEILEMKVNISSYTARHSFATILKRSGVPVSAISDFLGHSDTKTTENYLAGFEKQAMKGQWEYLIPKKDS